jgi:crotonobetainyl-CoA:carnitine CoA-transferase CaiB-like acyl-CoA transferase
MPSLPLSDLRIVAVEQYGAGPWGTLQLADLGAEVIKIEDPRVGGDVGRYVPPFAEGEDSLFFETFNRNKRSVSLDLKSSGGRAAFERLVAVSDVVFSNLRGDQPARLGLTFEQLRHVNERIVCCSLSGFGMTGPRAAEGAYDYTIQGLAGWSSLTGEPEGPPGKSALSLVDFSGGYVAAIAMLAGVLGARRDGVGCDYDLSLFETALAELTYVGTWQASRGFTPPRSGTAHASMVPFQTFAAQDGSIVIACPKQALWARLCEVLGEPGWIDDARFRGFAERRANTAELVALIEGRLALRTVAEWLELLGAAGVPSAPVNSVAEALADPQVAARGGIVEYDHPVLGEVRQLASPLRAAGAVPPVRRAPGRGEDTVDVLRELCGYDDRQLAELGLVEPAG